MKTDQTTKMLRQLRRRASSEGGVETIEWISISAALVALLGGVWVAFDRGGAQRVGAAVVHTTQCWISSLSGENECPPLQEVAQAPDEAVLTPEATAIPTPNWNCILAAPGFRAGCPEETVLLDPRGQVQEPPWGDDPLGWLIFDWDPQELLDWMPEHQRGMLLGGAGGLTLLLFLWALGLLGAGSALALMGMGGLLAAVIAGWLYGQLAGEAFSNEVAFILGTLAWLLGTLGPEGLRRGPEALIPSRAQRRRARKVLARPAWQEPPPQPTSTAAPTPTPALTGRPTPSVGQADTRVDPRPPGLAPDPHGTAGLVEERPPTEARQLVINWEVLIDPVKWWHLTEVTAMPPLLGGLGVFFFAETGAICAATTGLGCAVAVPILVPAGVGSFWSGFMLVGPAIEEWKLFVEAAFEIVPVK